MLQIHLICVYHVMIPLIVLKEWFNKPRNEYNTVLQLFTIFADLSLVLSTGQGKNKHVARWWYLLSFPNFILFLSILFYAKRATEALQHLAETDEKT